MEKKYRRPQSNQKPFPKRLKQSTESLRLVLTRRIPGLPHCAVYQGLPLLKGGQLESDFRIFDADLKLIGKVNSLPQALQLLPAPQRKPFKTSGLWSVNPKP